VLATACAAHQPGPEGAPPREIRLAADPPAVLTAIREEALARGFRIAAEAEDSLEVDFGVRPFLVVRSGDGGVVARWRTEVHASARYRVEPEDGAHRATVVTVLPATSWWHPDLRSWIAGPPGEGPGLDLLTTAAGLQ